MDLTKIVLEQVEFPDFENFLSYWHKDEQDDIDCVFYSRIKNPLMYETYEYAIEDFFNHPVANQLSVNEKGRWKRVNARYDYNLEKVVEDFSETARADAYKQNFFEMKFGYGMHSYDLLVVSFVELHNKVIVGHDVRVPMNMSSYLSIKQQKNSEEIQSGERFEYKRAHGIWVP